MRIKIHRTLKDISLIKKYVRFILLVYDYQIFDKFYFIEKALKVHVGTRNIHTTTPY